MPGRAILEFIGWVGCLLVMPGMAILELAGCWLVMPGQAILEFIELTGCYLVMPGKAILEFIECGRLLVSTSWNSLTSWNS